MIMIDGIIVDRVLEKRKGEGMSVKKRVSRMKNQHGWSP